MPAVAEGADGYLVTLESLLKPDPKPISVGVPSGFGASRGLAFASVAYTNADRNTGVAGDDDGSIALGIGLGDPGSGFALEAVIGITSVSTGFWGDGTFGDEGNLALKLHRRVAGLPGADVASLSFGVSNALGWGSTRDLPRSWTVAYSQVSTLQVAGDRLPLNATFGYGTSISAVSREPGAFGSVGIGLTGSLSAGFGWVGDELQIGAVYFPAALPSASLGVTYADATHRHSDRGRVIVSLNMTFDKWSRK
ncbi:MAG: hypothetical protein Q27BPR15_16095 [Rhodobacter sp. CACIA14H1]|nr:MAG: hypothetical protein Q27BPR15_16095 [Rhodobacter sp. CACIA14H1]